MPQILPRINWTPEMDQVIWQNYESNRESVRKIAAILSNLTGSEVREQQVISRIAIIGAGMTNEERGRKDWTPEEEERLAQLLETRSAADAARILGRGIISVKLKAKRLGVSLRSKYGWYSASDIADVLGIDIHRVVDWIDAGLLPGYYHYGGDRSAKGARSWHIKESDFANFLRRYGHQLRGRNVDLSAVVDILVGRDTPRVEKMNPQLMPTKHEWTEDDKEYVRMNFDFTHESMRRIAAYLSHKHNKEITEWQVRWLADHMGLLRSFTVSLQHQPWSKYEDRTLMRIIQEGGTLDDAASALHRGVDAVRNRAELLNLSTYRHDKYYSIPEVAEMLGARRSEVYDWIRHGALAAAYQLHSQHMERRPEGWWNLPQEYRTRSKRFSGTIDWFVKADDLVKFIRKYAQQLRARRVDLGRLIDIVSGR